MSTMATRMDSIDFGRKLLSALGTPRPVFGHDEYPTLAKKAAVLLYSVAKAHALPNGNERLAMTTTFLNCVCELSSD